MAPSDRLSAQEKPALRAGSAVPASLPMTVAATATARRPRKLAEPGSISALRPVDMKKNGSSTERGLAAEVGEARRRRWLEENREAMEAWNDHVAGHGLPLAAFRQF